MEGSLPLQKIGVKILADAPAALRLDPILAIFGRWRADTSYPAEWVDLADYAHMAGGAGIVLVGKAANFSFDMGGAGPGILYVTKKGLHGALEDRLCTALRNGFELTAALVAEPEFPLDVHLRSGSLDLSFNDRLETPNVESTDRLLRPVVARVLDGLLGPDAYELKRQPDPGKLYGFSIHAPSAPDLAVLLARLRG